MAAIPVDLIDVTTAAALQEKKKLQKHFARFDILFFLICTLVGLDTIGPTGSRLETRVHGLPEDSAPSGRRLPRLC